MRVVEIADRSVLTRWLLMLLAVVLGVGLSIFQSPPVLADPTSDPSADPSSGVSGAPGRPEGSAGADGPDGGSVPDGEWVEPTGEGLVRPDWVSAGVTARSKNARVEVLSERSEMSRTWVLPDGTAVSEQTQGPARFRDPKATGTDGWRDIDLSLTQDSKGAVSPKGVPGGLTFAGASSSDAALITATSSAGAELVVGAGLGRKLPKPSIEGRLARYVDVVPGVDVTVEARRTGFELLWVVKSAQGAAALVKAQGAKKSLVAPKVKAKKTKLKPRKDGGVDVTDVKGKKVGSFAAPVMWDAKTDLASGEPTNVRSVDFAVSDSTGAVGVGEEASGDLDLGVVVDQGWLSDPGRVFPVSIDPTYASTTGASYFDTFVQQGYSTDESASAELKLGNNGSGQVARSYLTFDQAKVDGKKIMSASLKLYNWHSWSCSARSWSAYDVPDVDASLRWTNQPTIGTKRASSSDTKGFSSSCPNGWSAVDMKAQMQAWADGSSGRKGVMLRATDESDAYGWKKFDSRNGPNPPVFTWTYNRAPATMAANTVAGAVAYQAVGDSAPVLYTADTTPTVSGVVSDPDGNTVQGKFYIDAPKYTGVTNCTSSSVASGATASCTWPAIPDGTDGWIRSRATDSNGEAGGWAPFTELRVAAATPAVPVVSCPSPYGNNTWQSAGPAANLSCTITATGSGYAAPSKIRWSVDNAAFTDTAITQSTSAATAKTTVSVPKANGGHSIRAYAISPAGKVSALATYSIGWGAPSLLAPKTAPVVTTTDRLAVEASGPPKGTSVAPTAKVQWRVAGASGTAGWVDAPAGTSLAVSEVSGATKAVGVFDTTSIVGQADGSGITVGARVATRVEVRVCLTYTSGTQCTPGSVIVRVPHAFGSGFPEADAGPGRVGLWTGEVSISDTDADLSTPDGGLSVSRAHTSFAGPALPQNAVFGPGWTAAFDGGGDGMAGSELIDSTHVDGALVVADPEGEALVFTTPTGARRTTAGLPTGDYLPADEDTELAGVRLTVSGTGTATMVKLVTDDGTVTTFKAAVAPAVNMATVFRAVEVADTAVAGKTTYTYDTQGRVTAIVAGLPDGVTTCVPGAPSKGCRVLKISYATTTATTTGDVTGQVKSISAQVNTDSDRQLASYLYDASGRLVRVTDTRSGLATDYTWAGSGTELRLASVKPAGLDAFTFTYANNKLATVTRPNPASAGGGTAQLAAYIYNLPVAGTIPDLPDMGTLPGAWNQAKMPTTGFAVFGPDAPISGTPAAGDQVWKSADLQFTDALGYTVNTASYGAGDWQLTGADYDDHDNIIRAWDERAVAAIRAGDVTDAASVATITTYNADISNAAGEVVTPAGSLVTDTYSPAHPVASGGELTVLRTHTHTSYDQGAPNAGINPDTGQPYRLPTKVVVTAEDSAGTVAETLSTAYSGYDALESGDKSGWTLGQATTSTTDMDGDGAVSAGDITARTRYDDRGRVIEQRQPKSDGTDAGTRQTVYYTAATSPVAACGNKPEYAGMICRVGPKAQPSGQTMPVTWTRSYTWDLATAESAEVSGSAEVVSTTSFDSKDRPSLVHTAATGLSGSTPVADVTTSYDNATGLATGTTSSTGTTTTGYDSWGRQVSLRTTADGVDDTATTTYDSAGRVTAVVDNNGETHYTYDGTDAAGKVERRGLVTTVAVKTTGGVDHTSAAGYDTGGGLIVERLPGQVIKRTTLDLTGEQTGLTYAGFAINPDTGTPEADQPWLGWSTTSNAQGQVIREWMPSGGSPELGTTPIASDRSYTYDRAGRLTTVSDITGNPAPDQPVVACQTRTYSFDANGNRTGQKTYDPAGDNSCQTTTSATSVTRSYDSADRPTTGANGAGSYAYDPLGRQTAVPAADAPHPGDGDISVAYYDTDAVKQIGQNGATTSFTLDGSARRLKQTSTDSSGTRTLIRHYTDNSDNPSWSVDTTPDGVTTTTRYAELASGDLGLTLTQTGGTTTGALALSTPRGDTAATITLPAGSAAFDGTAVTGLDTWTDYTEYGAPKQPVNTTPGATTGIGYGWLGTKQRATLASGLTLMGARLYNQSTALFTSTDPQDNGGDTTYGYPNDPINDTDLDGNSWWRRAGGWAYRHRGALATAGATLGCLAPGVGWALCGAMQAAAWGIRSHQRAAENGGWRRNARAIAIDGVVTIATVGLGSGWRALKYGRSMGGRASYTRFRYRSRYNYTRGYARITRSARRAVPARRFYHYRTRWRNGRPGRGRRWGIGGLVGAPTGASYYAAYVRKQR